MSLPEQTTRVIDYRQENAAASLLPNSAVLSSSGWSDIHLTLYQQPKFDIAEHHHTLHVIALALPCPSAESECNLSGDRWLDGKQCKETRNIGDIAIIPARISHRCNWNSSVQFMTLAIEPTLLKQIGQDWVNLDRIELIPRFMTEQDALLQSIFSALRDELKANQMGSYLLIDSLKTALAIHLIRNYCATSPKPFNSSGLGEARLALVKDYIQVHLHQDLKLNELAAIAQISPYHFLRLFKQSVGLTPHQYILRCRVEKAKTLMQHGELSLAEVAVKTGFYDQSHLGRSFKQIVGMTLKQFLQF